MKRYTKSVLICLLIAVMLGCFLSCGGSVNLVAESQKITASVTLGYDPDSKDLLGSKSITINLNKTIIDNSNIGLIKKEFANKKIYSVLFTSVTEINALFNDLATSLKTIEADESLTKIDYSVFEECTTLSSVILNSEVQVQNNSFPSDNTATFVIPQEMIPTYRNYFPDATYEGIYSINLDLNGNTYQDLQNPSIDKNKYNVKSNDTVSDVNVPTADNAKFQGFYKDADTDSTQLFDESGVAQKNIAGFTDANGNWISEEDITIYAHWKYCEYINLDFNTSVYKNLRNPSIENQKVAVYSDEEITDVNIPTADNAVFLGFYKTTDTTMTQVFDENGTPQNSVEGLIDADGNWIAETDTTLYAHWIIRKGMTVNGSTDIILRFDPNNLYGIDNPSFVSTTINIGAAKTAVEDVPENPDPELVIEGFYIDKDFNTKVFDYEENVITVVDGDVENYVTEGKWDCIFANVDVFANWKKKITVTLNKNTTVTDDTFIILSDSDAEGSATMFLGQHVRQITVPTAENGDFLGYYKDADTTETQFFDKNGAPKSAIENYIDENGNWISEEGVTLYAHWKFKSTINLELNTGFFKNLSNATIENGRALVYLNEQTEEVNVPTADNADFLGFYKNSDTTATQVFDKDGEPKSNIDGLIDTNGNWIATTDTTLYAHWAIRKGETASGSSNIIICFDPNGTYQTEPSSIETEISINTSNTTISEIPENPTNPGLFIEGYFLDKEYTTKILKNDGTLVNGDVKNYVTDGKWDCLFANVEVYAKWNNKITITLDKNGGVTDGEAVIFLGEKSVNSITHAVGTHIVDYYGDNTQVNTGNVIIDSDGTLRPNVSGYTDENGCWIWNDGSTLTLYTQYTEDLNIIVN